VKSSSHLSFKNHAIGHAGIPRLLVVKTDTYKTDFFTKRRRRWRRGGEEEEKGQRKMILKIETFSMLVPSNRIHVDYMQEDISLYILVSLNCGRPSINCFPD
jgi:hypothetical protein